MGQRWLQAYIIIGVIVNSKKQGRRRFYNDATVSKSNIFIKERYYTACLN